MPQRFRRPQWFEYEEDGQTRYGDAFLASMSWGFGDGLIDSDNDGLLGQSAVDRFAHAAYDLVVEGESYRAKLKPKVRDDDPPPPAPADKKPTIGRRR